MSRPESHHKLMQVVEHRKLSCEILCSPAILPRLTGIKFLTIWTGGLTQARFDNGPLIHWDCSIWYSFDFASNRDFFSDTKQHKKPSAGFARNPLIKAETQKHRRQKNW